MEIQAEPSSLEGIITKCVNDLRGRYPYLSEDEIAAAMRVFYSDTHNIAEPAAAAGLAGLMREQEQYAGKNVGVILSGSNVDASVYRDVLAGNTPAV